MSGIDPITVIDSLDLDQLREQLDALDRQQAAIRVLLRAALARRRDEERAARTTPARQPREVTR